MPKAISKAFEVTIAFLLMLAGAFVFSVSAHGYTVPTFPSCANPQGNVVANYDNGVHGIVGDTASYTGNDTVYSIDSTKTLQCFCSGQSGVQTNWWKADGLTQQEIDQLEKLGWVYVPSGNVWGLDSSPYMAANLPLDCDNGNVLGISNTNEVKGDSALAICGRCFWWPILLSEIALLLIAYLLLKRKNILKVNALIPGAAIATIAYVIFVLVNGGKCPFGVIDLKVITIPCSYFWILDFGVFVLIAWLLRNKKKFSKK